MNAAAEFFAMGGYGVFVWSAYAAAALVILGLSVWSWLGLRRAEQREVQIGRRERRRSNRGTKT